MKIKTAEQKIVLQYSLLCGVIQLILVGATEALLDAVVSPQSFHRR